MLVSGRFDSLPVGPGLKEDVDGGVAEIALV
jgi:hypothetical protein